MKQRYHVGFDKGVRCAYLEGCPPDSHAIVDTLTPFVWGEIVAVCPTKKGAETIVRALNAVENLREYFK